MTQVLVKTSATMLGSHSYNVAPEVMQAFTGRPDVWWYCIPDDEETLDGSAWHKGGAWAVSRTVTPEYAAQLKAEIEGSVPVYGVKAGELPDAPLEEKREPVVPPAVPAEDEDGGRW